MKKIVFQDLKALIEVFGNSESQRMILSHHTGDQFLWRGSSGFYNQILTVYDFCEKYLASNDIFDASVHQIKMILERIPKDEYQSQVISIQKNKENLFSVLNAIERLEQQILHHYSINTLFQFTNITFNSDVLFSKIEDVFEKATWNFIPENAKGDIVEGGKALLFNLPTSASFMFLRALEDCIRKICKALNNNEKQITFGQAITTLEKERASFNIQERDFDRQIGYLKYIKDEFRNPSAHPDKTFTQKEAEQLFQAINVSIDKMRYIFDNIK